MIKGGEMLIFSRTKKIKIVIEFQHYILNRFFLNIVYHKILKFKVKTYKIVYESAKRK